MKRRTFLKGAGSATVLTTITSGRVGARPDGSGPSDSVETGRVTPIPWFEPQSVSTGEWIEHSLGWAVLESDIDPDETGPCEHLRDSYLDNREYRFELPDRTIDFDESDRYWGDCRYVERTDPPGPYWGIEWTFATPPKPPGKYEFSFVQKFTEPTEYEDPLQDPIHFEPGDTISRTGTYTVTRSSGRGPTG